MPSHSPFIPRWCSLSGAVISGRAPHNRRTTTAAPVIRFPRHIRMRTCVYVCVCVCVCVFQSALQSIPWIFAMSVGRTCGRMCCLPAEVCVYVSARLYVCVCARARVCVRVCLTREDVKQKGQCAAQHLCDALCGGDEHRELGKDTAYRHTHTHAHTAYALDGTQVYRAQPAEARRRGAPHADMQPCRCTTCSYAYVAPHVSVLGAYIAGLFLYVPLYAVDAHLNIHTYVCTLNARLALCASVRGHAYSMTVCSRRFVAMQSALHAAMHMCRHMQPCSRRYMQPCRCTTCSRAYVPPHACSRRSPEECDCLPEHYHMVEELQYNKTCVHTSCMQKAVQQHVHTQSSCTFVYGGIGMRMRDTT